MKRATLFLLAAMGIGLVGCEKTTGGDDDELFGAAKVGLNEGAIGSSVQKVTATLGIRSPNPSQEDVGAHYLDVYFPDDVQGRFDLGTPLMGKTIDLGDPLEVVGNYQFSFGFHGKDYKPLFGMDIHDGKVNSYIGEQNQHDRVSLFTSGRMKLVHDSKGFELEMYGKLRDGQTFSLHVLVEEDKIDYW